MVAKCWWRASPGAVREDVPIGTYIMIAAGDDPKVRGMEAALGEGGILAGGGVRGVEAQGGVEGYEALMPQG